MSRIIIIKRLSSNDDSSGGFGSIIALLLLGGLVFGLGRCLGCDWAKSEAELALEKGGEIGWSVTAQLDPGRYTFKCVAKGVEAIVVGSGPYDASESSVCAAAVHAGALRMENGGDVTIDVHEVKGKILSGSRRHGIKSVDGAYQTERKRTLSEGGSADWKDKVFTIVP